MDSDIVRLLLALLLVLLNGFFVAAEFSIVKVRYSQIQLKAAEGNSMAKQAEHIIKHLDEYLSATQLGITLASLALGWVGESALHHIVENIFSSLNVDLTETTVTSISVITSFVLITIMHIVFGELIPKSIAIRKSESTTMATAIPLRVFYTVFKPFIWLMNLMSNTFLRLVKIHPASEHEIHSTEELQLLVKQSADSGEIEEENRKLNCRGVFVEVLRTSEYKALVYVYRKKKLEQDLQCEGACALLKDCGYECQETDCCIRQLQERFFEKDGFPHEVGLFLGYPLDDVTGFIEQKGKNYKCCGIWKVYGNEKQTQMLFRKLKKCSEIYRRLWADGRSILQLTVAA